MAANAHRLNDAEMITLLERIRPLRQEITEALPFVDDGEFGQRCLANIETTTKQILHYEQQICNNINLKDLGAEPYITTT